MAIRYTLRPFKPGKASGAHAAHVLYGQPAGAADILDRVVSGGSTLTRADVAACGEALAAAVASLVCEGRRVNLFGIAEVYPCVRGTFEDDSERFDAARHTLDAGACAGEKLRREVRSRGRAVRLQRGPSSPNITGVCLPGQSAPAGTIVPGALMRITGKRLKVDESNADEGVFLVSATGRDVVACRQIAGNRPSELLVFAPPDLPEGDWTLEVRARMRHASAVSTGRFGSLAALSAAAGQLPAAA